jgi:transcriptional regulator GlxA family with amidase domain
MREWAENIASGKPELRKVVEMEIEGRLHRLALTAPRKVLHPGKSGGEDALARLLGTFCEGATEGCPVEELCRRARLHPKYAMKLFRRECGITLLQYLHQLRVSHAQRLLMTTGEQIIDIALASGFGSAASFYEIFKNETGAKPSAFRNAEGCQ